MNPETFYKAVKEYRNGIRANRASLSEQTKKLCAEREWLENELNRVNTKIAQNLDQLSNLDEEDKRVSVFA